MQQMLSANNSPTTDRVLAKHSRYVGEQTSTGFAEER
jgi:hypothetical protein